MKQSYIWIIVIVVIVVAAAIYWQVTRTSGLGGTGSVDETIESVGGLTEAAKQLVPTEAVKVPETNPVEKLNPFSKVYKNPFE